MHELETMLAPVTPDQPSGSALEYDPAFTSLFELARGKPEQRMGESVIPAEPPDWCKVEKGAMALLARTKDVRVAILWARARLHTTGAAGLFDGLALIRRSLERHWETIHPPLDADDGNDPVLRLNAVAQLADPDTVVASLREAELASVRGLGRVRVRDLERAAGGNPVAATNGEEPVPPVDLIFAKCDRAALGKMAEGALAALADLRAIEALLGQKVGAYPVPSFAKLAAPLQLVARVLSEKVLPDRSPKGARADEQAHTSGASGPSPGAINTREDVMRALDGLCAYFERHEPSSPIPILLRRSKRLVAMSFLDIVRDLVPDAAPHVEKLQGKHG